MYNCDQVAEFVYDYMENRLNFFTRKRFNMHLKTCPNCNQYVKLYSSAANPQEFLQENPIPPELTEKTLSFLEEEGILKGSESI